MPRTAGSPQSAPACTAMTIASCSRTSPTSTARRSSARPRSPKPSSKAGKIAAAPGKPPRSGGHGHRRRRRPRQRRPLLRRADVRTAAQRGNPLQREKSLGGELRLPRGAGKLLAAPARHAQPCHFAGPPSSPFLCRRTPSRLRIARPTAQAIPWLSETASSTYKGIEQKETGLAARFLGRPRLTWWSPASLPSCCWSWACPSSRSRRPRQNLSSWRRTRHG